MDDTQKKQFEAELREVEEKYSMIANNMSDVVVLLNEECRVEYVNPAIKGIAGVCSQECRSRYLLDVCQCEDHALIEKTLEDSKADGEQTCITRIRSKEDDMTWVRFSSKFLSNERKYVCVIRDITERKIIEEDQKRYFKLQNTFIELISEVLIDGINNDSYKRILDLAVDFIPNIQAGSMLIENEAGRYEFVAARGYDFNALKTITFSRDELAQAKNGQIEIIDHLPDINREKLDEDRANTLKTSGRTIDIVETLSIPITARDGKTAYFNLDNQDPTVSITEESIRMARLFSDAIKAVMKKLELEKELIRKNEQLQRLSNYDPLTNLPNRRYLAENIESLLSYMKRYNRELALIYLDLDNFKTINDSFGHDCGDSLLTAFGERIEKVLRKSDLVARIGGDEFVFVLPEIARVSVVEFIKRIVDAIHEPFILRGHTFNIDASLGVSMYPVDGDSFESLIKKADMAMYEAKRNKTHYQFYDLTED